MDFEFLELIIEDEEGEVPVLAVNLRDRDGYIMAEGRLLLEDLKAALAKV